MVENEQHNIYLSWFDNKLNRAPISAPQRALDLGTGAGQWAIDFADHNPQCVVTAVDLI